MIHTLMIVHGIITLILITLVLLQFGKGAEAGLFSGGGSDAVFSGSQQGNILSKMTIVMAVLFFANSILLARMQGRTSGDSLLDDEAPIARPLNSDAQSAAPLSGDKATSADKVENAVSEPNSAPENTAPTKTE